jgi:hypothetical protein
VEFIRVVHRRGWDVEVVEADRIDKRNFPEREQALEFARSLGPEWIELGEVVAAGQDLPQHHRWTTLRRSAGGDYLRSGLNWGGPSRGGPGASE